MNQALFKDFDPSTKEEWYQQALKDLKGKDFDKTLQWPTDEGFVVAPYYTEQDLPPIHQYIQEICQEKLPGWLNLIAITYTDEKTTNQAIKSNLSVGGDAFVIDFENKKTEEINWSKLLDGIKLSDVPIYFKIKCQGKSLSEVLRKIIPYQMKGGISDDILAQLMQTGVFPKNAFEDLAALISYTQNSPQFRSLSVDTTIFHNAGASATQELAFGLASGVTYLDKLTDLGLKVEEILPKMYFSVSIGTNYFMEIAKLRALRFLWRRIANQWTQEVPYTPIHAFTSTFYDAALTPNTNMLRATTEAMSAVVGGGDLLSVHAYDFVFQTPDDFSERIARNISLLLKEESYLGKTSDPAAGSYYIENLTAQLVEKAWGLFLEVESKGGVMAAFEQNFIQEQIENTFQKRLAALQSNERIMVGVNKFQFDQATIAKDAPSNEAALLNPRRLAAIFEK